MARGRGRDRAAPAAQIAGRAPGRHGGVGPRARLRGCEGVRGRPLRERHSSSRSSRSTVPSSSALIEADHLGRLRTGAASACCCEVSRARGCDLARGDRLRHAGRDAGHVHPRRGADDRAGRRLLPDRAQPRGILQARRRGAGGEQPRGRRAGRRRHDHELARSRSARRVASTRVPSSAPPARTSRRHASSTTSSSSARRSSAATGRSRRGSSPPI